jgi:hypothetical protein
MMFKVQGKVLFPMHEGYNNVLEAKKTIFWSRYGLVDFRFLFLDELDTCPQDCVLMRHMEP